MGVGVFLVSYSPAAIAGARSTHGPDKRLLIPFAGPWTILDRDCAAQHCMADASSAKALIIASGAAQAAGLLLAIGSLVFPETTRREPSLAKLEQPSATILPMAFGAGAGIGATGRF